VAVGEDGSVASTGARNVDGCLATAFVGVIDKSRLTENEGGIEGITHGTTVATNAVIQWHGAPVVLVTTRGFEYVPLLQRLAGLSSGPAVREAQRRRLRKRLV
jgi:N-methylhydantoinase A/oxoprolinase/acetone carboxylase beta subunit